MLSRLPVMRSSVLPRIEQALDPRYASFLLLDRHRDAVRRRSRVFVIMIGDFDRNGMVPFGHLREGALESLLIGAIQVHVGMVA